jgi:hypothetical protein
MSVDVLANVLSNIDLSSTDQTADLNSLAAAIEEALLEAAPNNLATVPTEATTPTKASVETEAPSPVKATTVVAQPITYMSGRKRPRSEFIPPLIYDLSFDELRRVKRNTFENLLSVLTHDQIEKFYKTRNEDGKRLRVCQ